MDDLFMKYMDQTITEKEATVLQHHLTSCHTCQNDFQLYDQILTGFALEEIVSAPEGFEDGVMCQIEALPVYYEERQYKADALMCWLWGSTSVLMGFGVLLYMNKETLLAYVAQTPVLACWAASFQSLSQTVDVFTSQISIASTNLLDHAVAYASSLRYVFLAGFVLLAVIQYALHKRGKVEA